MITLIVGIVVLAFIFDFSNGFHDTANAIATAVSTRALPPRVAVVLAAVLNAAGALTFTGVAQSIGQKITNPLHLQHGLKVVLAALVAAIAWNLLTWYYGIPSSSSHALIGSLTGAVISAAGLSAINFAGFRSIVEGLVLSPVAALLIGYIVMTVLKFVFRNRSPHRVNRWFRLLQIASACFQSFSHGTNDAQKTMGIVTFALVAGGFQNTLHVPLWVMMMAAAAMGLGTSVGGWRIIRTVGSKIIHLLPINGFASDMTSASVILTATLLRAPVSTTHVISSAIVGTGAAFQFRSVKWITALRIVVAWVITMPVAALLAGLMYQFIARL